MRHGPLEPPISAYVESFTSMTSRPRDMDNCGSEPSNFALRHSRRVKQKGDAILSPLSQNRGSAHRRSIRRAAFRVQDYLYMPTIECCSDALV